MQDPFCQVLLQQTFGFYVGTITVLLFKSLIGLSRQNLYVKV